MSLIASVICVNCYQLYDDSRKPCVGTCHDSVCQPCRQQMKVFTCPTCGKKDAFKEETVNWHGMLMQEAILRDLTEDTIEEFVKNQKDKNSGPCQECGDLAKKLRICLDCAAEQKILIPQVHSLTINLSSNITALGAFFKAKQFSICANCATDGEHSEHKCDLLANVYDESMVDRELDFVLRRIVHLKYGKEMEQGKHWLNEYKQDILKIEMYRQTGLIFPSEEDIGSHPECQEEIREVREDVSLYQRRLHMLYVEEIQMRHADSEDEEFQKKIREVIEKIVKEEEKLSIEELAKVEEKVKERILKNCEEDGDGFEDCKKSREDLESARVNLQHLLNTCLTDPMDDIRIQLITAEEFAMGNATEVDEETRKEMREKMEKELLDTFDSGHLVYSFGEEYADMKRKCSIAELDYYKAYALQSLCSVAFIETKKMLVGRGIRLEHPNLQKYLSLFRRQIEQDSGIGDSYHLTTVLYFP